MKKRAIFLFISILLIGITLRVYNLSKYDFWYDEVFSIIVAKEIGFLNITYYGYLIDPPLFYSLLSFWLRSGNSEFILRLLPFIFGVLSIPAIYLVGKELFDKKVGLIAAFILAISPFHIYYSQELRTYSLVTFLALMAIYYLIRSLKENKIPYWAGLIVFTTLLLYSHNIAAFFIIVLNVCFLIFYKRYKALLPRWLISQFLILLFYLPWVGIVFEQISRVEASNLLQWIPRGYLLNFIRTFFIFNLGPNANEVYHFIAILLVFPLFLLGIWDNKKKEIYLVLSWLFIPILMSMIVSNLITFVFLFRTLIYVSPAYYILISYGLSKIKPRKAFLCLLLLFSILSGLSLKNYYQNIFYSYKYTTSFKGKIKPAANYINQNYQKGDVVGHPWRITYLPFLYYHNRRLDEKHFALIGQDKEASFRLEILKKLKLISINLKEIKNGSYKRIWLVLSSWANNQTYQLSRDFTEYLDRDYIMIESKEFKGLTINLYQNK